MDDPTKTAIDATLSGNYQRAIILNKLILKKNKNDVEALNRLACAYLETGDLKKAKKIYKKGLALDCYNQIIIKNLKKIGQLKGKPKKQSGPPLNLNDLFLSEPGKTKLISLVNLPSSSTFLHLTPGTSVFLVPKKRSIAVCLENQPVNPSTLRPEGRSMLRVEKSIYLGTLPDDLSFRLIRLLKNGNRYEACLKSVSKNSLVIFIKEVFRTKRYKDRPSF